MFVHPPRSRRLHGFIAFSLALLTTVYSAPGNAAESSVGNGSAPPALEGKEIFEARCAACHGPDGRGGPGRELLKADMPDFTDCAFASREPDADFAAVIHGGGPARGFSAQMPAHGQASSQAEMDEINARLSGGGEPGPALGTGLDRAGIARVIAYLRSFCSDERWPRGELNLPRPLITEKAFPEDEVVITTFANVNREGFVSNHLLFEKRIGPRAMVEMDLPVTSREWERGGRTEWYSGVGDFAIGTKYAFFHSLESGSIASLGAELKVPTGDDERGLGNGSVVFEPYLAAGQFLPWDSFVQMQLLGEIPTSGAGEISLRGTLGTSFTPILHGRTFSPMVEVIGVFALGKHSEENLDIVPQIQIPLNRRQHVRLNVGVWIPATRNDSRPTRVGAYLLWDWFDGGLFDGW